MEISQLLPLLLHFDQHLGGLILQHQVAIYALLFLVVFVEIGILPLFFLPGDPLLFVCGTFCAMGRLHLWVLLPLLWIAAVLGSLLGYGLGRMLGQRAYALDGRWLDRVALDRAHAYYERFGALTLLMSPFIAVVRTFAPFAGGVARMTFARFLAAMLGGTVLWVVTLVPGGYFFGNLPLLRDHLGALVLLGLAIGLVCVAGGALLRLSRH